MNDLEILLKETGNNHKTSSSSVAYANILIVEGVYSTDGSICPLAEVTRIAKKYDCTTILDETHSFGVHGPHGAGLACALNLADSIHIRTIGLSKADPLRGAITVGSKKLIECIRWDGPVSIFSTPIQTKTIPAHEAAISCIQKADVLRQRLHDNHVYLKEGLLKRGYPVEHCMSQIIALTAGTEERVVKIRDKLAEYGIIVSGFFYPAAPPNQAFIRMCVHSDLNRKQADYTLDVFDKEAKTFELDQWPRVGEKSTPSLKLA